MSESPDPRPSRTEIAAQALLDPHLRKVVLTIGYMIILAGLILGLTLVWPVIVGTINVALPFLVALIIAYVLNPIVTFLSERLRLQRIGGLLVFYLILLVVLGGFMGWVVPILYKQSKAAFVGITQTVPEKANEFLVSQQVDPQALWTDFDEFLKRYNIDSRELIKQAAGSEGAQQAARTAATGSVAVIETLFTSVFDFVFSLFSSLSFLVFVVLISFYFIVDFWKFRGILEILIPLRHRERTFAVLSKCDVAVGGFLRGQLISASLVGLLVFIGLTFLGMGQYALLIGVIAAVGNLVPYLGPILAGAPAVLYMLLSDRFAEWDDRLVWSAVTLGLFVVVQQIDGFVFQPRIVGKNAQLHPVVVLLALIAGANFGIMGMIVAVPVASIARVLLKEFFWDRREESWRRETGKTRLDQSMPDVQRLAGAAGPPASTG